MLPGVKVGMVLTAGDVTSGLSDIKWAWFQGCLNDIMLPGSKWVRSIATSVV